MSKTIVLKGRKIVGGKARGEALVAHETISFWGEYDCVKGKVIKPDSPLFGQSFRGKILVIESTKGSSGNVMAFKVSKLEKNAPEGMIIVNVDCLGVFGCIVADIPVVAELDKDPFKVINTGDLIEIDADNGVVRVLKGSE